MRTMNIDGTRKESRPDPKPPKDSKPRYTPKIEQKADWTEADAGQLKRTICLVTSAGDAMMFGYTSDGGALVLTIISTPPTPKIYLKPSDDVNIVLEEIAVAYEDEK